MERLQAADLDRVMHLGSELAAADDAEAFPMWLLERLRSLLGSDDASYCELDRVACRVLELYGTPAADGGGTDEATFWRLRHQYASCAHQDRTGDFSSSLISDFTSQRELHRLEIYADFFRPHGVEYSVGAGLPAPLTHTKMFLFANGARRRDFGERERSILELLRPQLHARYEYVRARDRADAALSLLETCDEPYVLVDARGRAEFATPRARRLLERYGLDLNAVPDVAPLTARVVRPGVLVLAEKRPGGLTRREREILALVAEGRSNADIARALWISPLTVGKHLENVYAKLGVSTRTAAVQQARERGALPTLATAQSDPQCIEGCDSRS